MKNVLFLSLLCFAFLSFGCVNNDKPTTPSEPAAPTEPANPVDPGAPSIPDTDGDGIPDSEDKYPDAPNNGNIDSGSDDNPNDDEPQNQEGTALAKLEAYGERCTLVRVGNLINKTDYDKSKIYYQPGYNQRYEDVKIDDPDWSQHGGKLVTVADKAADNYTVVEFSLTEEKAECNKLLQELKTTKRDIEAEQKIIVEESKKFIDNPAINQSAQDVWKDKVEQYKKAVASVDTKITAIENRIKDIDAGIAQEETGKATADADGAVNSSVNNAIDNAAGAIKDALQ